MSHIRPIFLIAGNTVTGILRGAVNVLLLLAAVSLIVSTTSGAFDPQQMSRTLIDSGLAVISVLGAMIAILTGFTMIPGEIEQRTLYPILSKPVRRWQFVLGKFFGAVGVNSITVGLLSLLFFVAYWLKSPGHQFDPRLIMAVLMIFAMLVVLSGLIIFFSTFMSWIGTIIATMVIWFVGNYSQFLKDMAEGSDAVGFSKYAFMIVQKLMPNFQAMDLRYDIVQLETVHFTASSILMPPGSASLYLIIALALAIVIFNYREL